MAALAEQRFETAMRLSPRSSHVLGAYSLHLSLLGQFDEAIALGQRSVELDPLMPFWRVLLTQVLMWSRRYDDVIRQADATIDLVSTYWTPLALRGVAQAALGHLTEAAETLERGGDTLERHTIRYWMARLRAGEGRTLGGSQATAPHPA